MTLEQLEVEIRQCLQAKPVDPSIGQMLAQAKRLCGHGQWVPWISRLMPERTARRYLKTANQNGQPVESKRPHDDDQSAQNGQAETEDLRQSLGKMTRIGRDVHLMRMLTVMVAEGQLALEKLDESVFVLAPPIKKEEQVVNLRQLKTKLRTKTN